LVLLILAAPFAVTGPAVAETIVGQASVIDGDTLEIHGQRIRILDIDTPEAAQLCQDKIGADYRCGQKAALALYGWIGDQTVICETTKLDLYRRLLARCSVQGQDVATWLAENGLGVPYRDCRCEVVRDAASRAKAAKVGLWAGKFDLPWVWRESH
jgi:endonuclease YncB( thermonuclease family)